MLVITEFTGCFIQSTDINFVKCNTLADCKEFVQTFLFGVALRHERQPDSAFISVTVLYMFLVCVLSKRFISE